jgi:hypothetical protein
MPAEALTFSPVYPLLAVDKIPHLLCDSSSISVISKPARKKVQGIKSVLD